MMPIILPPSWKRITSVAKLPEGVSKWSKNGKKFAIYYQNSEIKSIFSDKCPHNGRVSLYENHEMDGTLITCVQHGACYNIIDGEQIKGPGENNLEFFDFRINGKYLEVYV